MRAVVDTLGCKVNDVESGSIIRGLEGLGFEVSREEEEMASRLGYASITLGKRILRAETAAVALTSVVMFRLGELR